jgi:uncharacterized membrane protein YecN with MAPEG domain
MMFAQQLPLLATAVALFVYVSTVVACGQARSRHGIKAPAITGHPDFERALRIQQNTVEQLVLFLPSLFLYSHTVSPLWGGVLGLVWSAGRVLYALGYRSDPGKRGPGFMLSGVATLFLLLGGTVGLIWSMLGG